MSTTQEKPTIAPKPGTSPVVTGSATTAPRPAAPSTATAPKAAPFQIVQPVRKERYLNLACYGEYGVGKTTFAASAEDSDFFKDVLFVDVESGDLVLQDRPGLDVVHVKRYGDIAQIHRFLKSHIDFRDSGNDAKIKEIDAGLRGGEGQVKHYKTVVIDSLSELAKLCLYEVSGVQIGNQPLDLRPDQPQFAEWNALTDMIRLMVRSFRDLKMHAIFVCSERSTEDRNKRSTIGLNLSKALATEVPGLVDVVAYLEVKSEGDHQERRLWLEPGHGFLAKNRFPEFKDAYIEDPTMEKLRELIK